MLISRTELSMLLVTLTIRYWYKFGTMHRAMLCMRKDYRQPKVRIAVSVHKTNHGLGWSGTEEASLNFCLCWFTSKNLWLDCICYSPQPESPWVALASLVIAGLDNLTTFVIILGHKTLWHTVTLIVIVFVVYDCILECWGPGYIMLPEAKGKINTQKQVVLRLDAALEHI